MNDPVYEIHTIESGTPPSPKRKKVRAKYAPKACVSCRRSKLKCSGENPCQRCHDGGRRCFYSEDQTAAEALQNLSRPPPVQHVSNGENSRTVIQRQESVEESVDGNAMGLTMEARMARVEGLLESLMHGSGLARAGSRDSVDRGRRMSDGGRSNSMVRPSDGLPTQTSSNSNKRRHSLISEDDPMSSIRIASRDLPFPDSSSYSKRVVLFFQELSPLYPCVNEPEFRARSRAMLSSPVVQQKDECFLALNFIIMACSELLIMDSEGKSEPPRGWQWFKLADELISKRKVTGCGDLSLIQCVLFQAVYFMHIDSPNSAYNTIGVACRLCIQFGLHRQAYWRTDGSLTTNHMRQRIFWAVYVTDRRISLSCGRPYGFRDSDIKVERPVVIADEPLRVRPLPESSFDHDTHQYFTCIISLAELGGQVWDNLCGPDAAESKTALDRSRMDDRLENWWDSILTHVSLLRIPQDGYMERSRIRQMLLVRTQLYHLRLLVWRGEMVSLNFTSATGQSCGELAIEIIKRTTFHVVEELGWRSFHFEMAISLAPAMLILAALLCRFHDNSFENQLPAYSKTFTEAATMIRKLGLNSHAPIAKRILCDFTPLIQALEPLQEKIDKGEDLASIELPQNIEQLFPYRALDFGQQAGLPVYNSRGDRDMNSENQVGVGSWDYDRRPAVEGHGVPWL